MPIPLILSLSCFAILLLIGCLFVDTVEVYQRGIVIALLILLILLGNVVHYMWQIYQLTHRKK